MFSKTKYCIVLFFLVCNAAFIFSQDTNITIADTIRNVVRAKDDTASYKPLKFILSDHKYLYINPTNPDTVTRKRFLWYNTKVTEDIFNYLPGYYLNYMDVGKLNPIRYNQFNPFKTALLRNERPLNDRMDYGYPDFNLFSRNEIEAIEVTNGFSNTINNFENTINIIQRQLFVNRAYTEISFTQDRYENLYFDGNFHQNLFRNLNFNFGITKHSYDGKYTNSDFDKWLGRFNLNFAASNKLNFFAYVNYADIKRGLNEGLDINKVEITDKDEVFDPVQAIVVNSDTYEKYKRFDIDLGAVLLVGKNSFTKLHLFESNSFREFRDEENRINSNGFFYKRNSQWILYGARLKQIFNLDINKNISIISRTEVEYDKVLMHRDDMFLDTSYTSQVDVSEYPFLTDIILNYKNLSLEGYFKGISNQDFSDIYTTGGLKSLYKYNIDSINSFSVFVAYDFKDTYLTGGISAVYNKIKLSAEYYNYKQAFIHYDQGIIRDTTFVRGINTALNFRFFKFDLDANFSTNLKRVYDDVPVYFGNVNLSFHDMAFRNKLEYKIGISSRGWSKYSWAGVNIPQNATLDFFIMGKIGRATFGLTLENILDRIVYNTGVYPYMDRGGFVNAISRFNITWNFTD